MTEAQQHFQAELRLDGKTATGIRVPPEVIEALGAGKKPAVVVTINGHAYRSSVAVRGGEYLLPVSAENREKAGITAGQVVAVALALDTQPRELAIPADLAAALADEPQAQAFFDGLSNSNRRRFVMGIDEAKTPETRQRRIAKTIQMLREGRTG